LEYQRLGNVKQCSKDCCANLSAEEVQRFAEGDDDCIPGESEPKDLPIPRYSFTSLPTTVNGGDLPFDVKQVPSVSTISVQVVHAQLQPNPTPTLTPTSVPASAPASTPAPVPAPMMPNTYSNFVQYVPSNIGGTATPNEPYGGTPQIEELWFYTPASAHATYTMYYSPSSAEDFNGLNPWGHRKADMSQIEQIANPYHASYQPSQYFSNTCTGYHASSSTPTPGSSTPNGQWSNYPRQPTPPPMPQYRWQ
jgi:hypothetical protein